MSRFKLFGILAAMAAAISGDRSLSDLEKTKQLKDVGRVGDDILFGGSHIPGRLPNQRQRRKRSRQTQRY